MFFIMGEPSPFLSLTSAFILALILHCLLFIKETLLFSSAILLHGLNSLEKDGMEGGSC